MDFFCSDRGPIGRKAHKKAAFFRNRKSLPNFVSTSAGSPETAFIGWVAQVERRLHGKHWFEFSQETRRLYRAGAITLQESDRRRDEYRKLSKELAMLYQNRLLMEEIAFRNRSREIMIRLEEVGKRYYKVQGGLCNQEYQPVPALRSRR